MGWESARPRSRARKAILANATHCAICGGPLNPDAPPRTPWSSTVDHQQPRSRGGDHFDPANLRAAHLKCNSSRGDGTRKRPQPARSRRW